RNARRGKDDYGQRVPRSYSSDRTRQFHPIAGPGGGASPNGLRRSAPRRKEPQRRRYLGPGDTHCGGRRGRLDSDREELTHPFGGQRPGGSKFVDKASEKPPSFFQLL